jgi:hypothetical protein
MVLFIYQCSISVYQCHILAYTCIHFGKYSFASSVLFFIFFYVYRNKSHTPYHFDYHFNTLLLIPYCSIPDEMWFTGQYGPLSTTEFKFTSPCYFGSITIDFYVFKLWNNERKKFKIVSIISPLYIMITIPIF